MATKIVFVVFILPVIFSLIFGSVVMADILQKPGRELNFMPGSYSSHDSPGHSNEKSSITIIGLSSQYSTTDPVEIQVNVADISLNCADLYITIYSTPNNEVITQNGFFSQCFTGEDGLLPLDDKFSKVVDEPGSYKITVDMISTDLKNTSTSAVFTVK